MKNLKKLSRKDLGNILGGRACTLSIQGSDGTWVTRTGTCDTYHTTSGGQYTGSVGYCNTGMGMVALTSNDGVSGCNS